MKKFLIICLVLLAVYFAVDILYFQSGIYIADNRPTQTFITVADKQIYVTRNGEAELFEMKGVDMGVGIPGHFATDFAISKETYLRWFGQIQEMGANCVRVYTILADVFYQAVYEYNKDNPNPLYIVHGVWVNDYIHNSHRDAYNEKFLGQLLEDSKSVVDIIHGKKKIYLGEGLGSGYYKWDISPWVLGYIIGVEWEPTIVSFTDDMQREQTSFAGEYMYTTEEASPFEVMLAQIGENIIHYESRRYAQQRLVAFSNWPTTDPFDYDPLLAHSFGKYSKVDVEHIKTTDRFISGTFASYHIYPYFPDYLNYTAEREQYVGPDGNLNTYYGYLKKINDYHTIPVIISEFGIPTSRGMASTEEARGRNQGGMSEADQATALVECYRDIKAAGCAGAVLFSWQDEWFKRTWNTMAYIDLTKTPYWSDYQTNEQYFGILAFDPGEEKSICYVDGDLSDWSEQDVIVQTEHVALSVKYDEKYVYLLARQDGFSETKKMFIPVDVTPRTGATFCSNYNLTFDRPCDFVIEINGETNSRMVVQERYEVMRAMSLRETRGVDPYEFPPAPDTTLFKPITLKLMGVGQALRDEYYKPGKIYRTKTYETGKLTYGNANPASPDFNSLVDFCFNGDYVEIKLPWQMLNFNTPSDMTIHDDYYLHYGIEPLKIKEMFFGVGDGSVPIALESVPLKGWGHRVRYHERLKAGYYALQKEWKKGAENIA